MRTRSEIAEMLSRNLGQVRALEAVDAAADAVLLGSELSDEQALDLLARIAEEPGLGGIAARFAKSRAHASWETAPSTRAAKP